MIYDGVQHTRDLDEHDEHGKGREVVSFFSVQT